VAGVLPDGIPGTVQDPPHRLEDGRRAVHQGEQQRLDALLLLADASWLDQRAAFEPVSRWASRGWSGCRWTLCLR
jgi:hypothetical protein